MLFLFQQTAVVLDSAERTFDLAIKAVELILIPGVYKFYGAFTQLQQDVRDITHALFGINGQPGSLKKIEENTKKIDELYISHLAETKNP